MKVPETVITLVIAQIVMTTTSPFLQVSGYEDQFKNPGYQERSYEVGPGVSQVGVVVGHIVEQHCPGCHIVVITSDRYSATFSSIIW